MRLDYDIVVVGGGHAGCEAAAAAAKLGSKTLLLTMNMGTIAQMSCNPAMGGIAKGQIVREIDALGGCSAKVTDYAAIQFRMLNRSKGPAMWSPRAQCDKALFSAYWKFLLEQTENLDLRQDLVIDFTVENGKVEKIITIQGLEIHTKAAVFTNGTFLNGKIHIGEVSFEGGRIGEPASTGLTERLKSLGFFTARLKTGTPVRIDGRTVDFSQLIEQKGDENPECFSYFNPRKVEQQLSCWMAYTNPEVHDILRSGFEKSPMFQGRIQGVGPRYCPSIEDKINRFSERDRHQLFLEPEGRNTNEYYLNGFSSSLPEEIQIEALHHILGFEHAKIFKPGYAIEYDYFEPTQLHYSLQTKIIENLFFAGQINGTTGYEEAAAQGLMAGINAHLTLSGKPPFVLSRSEAYIGVLIDDLISKGVEEPYRMFTSRAEYRILLRQDNADSRLIPLACSLGMQNQEMLNLVLEQQKQINDLANFIQTCKVQPEQINTYLNRKESSSIIQKTSLQQLLLRPQIALNELINETPDLENFIKELKINELIIEKTEILIKYQSYIEKEQETAKKLQSLEQIKIPSSIDYFAMPFLSMEAREKLTKQQPLNLGQASKISGITPSDITALMIFIQNKAI